MVKALWHLIKQPPRALVASIALHLVLFVIVGFSINHTSVPTLPNKPIVKTVQAVVVDAAKVDAELKKLKIAEKRKHSKEDARNKKLQREAKKAKDKRRNEEKRLADLKRKQKKLAKVEKLKQIKLDKERKKKQRELARLEKKHQLELKKLAVVEAKRIAAEDSLRKKKEAKARRKAEAVELKRQMEEEERRNAELTSRIEKLRAQYVQSIMNHVQRYWLKPSNIQKGWKCDVSVQQNALGDVTHVKMLNCFGNEGFKSSVERAVKKASPLPSPKDPRAFDRNIQFTFNPKT